MARLRFPGRPGHRFDRISVKYFADDYRNITDPSLAFLPRFQSGLKEFRELTGASDEENEFEGFTKEEVKKSERKLKEHLEKEKKEATSTKDEASPTSEDEGPVLVTRLGRARHSLDSLPASERTRNRIKTLVRKSYSEVLKTGLVSPGKTHAVVKLREISHVSPPPPRGRPRSFKLDFKHEIQEAVIKTEKPAANVKKTEKDRAKFLLEKAKQANMLMQQKAIKRKVSPGIKYPKKQFVLPTQSSRSSRVIKPNKRFLEDESFNSDVKKKSKLGVSSSDFISTQNSSLNATQNSSLNASANSPVCETTPSKTSIFSSKYFSDKSPGLYDQPLICAGKRDRKPSLKLRLGSEFDGVDTYSKFEQQFYTGKSPPGKAGGLTSPLAAPKLGTSLFTSPGSQAQFQKASENQRLGMLGLGSARKQGASIVQKAKLQLNRAALNKSKAALAKSLKAEMKREAKIAEQAKKQDVVSPVNEPVTSPVPEEPKKKRKRKCCVVCSQKTELQLYKNILVCLACKFFFWKVRSKFKSHKLGEFQCREQKGKCKITAENKSKCRYCRLKSCIDAGFPQAETLQHLLIDPTVKAEPKSPAVLEEVKSPVRSVPAVKVVPAVKTTPTPKQPVPKTPAVKIMVSEECNTDPSLTQYKSEQELSPLKAEEGSEKKHKKRRAFKELLRTKQEKPEPAISVEVTPTTPVPPPKLSPVQGSVEESPSPGAPGPRIKHVCRNAAVVLGKPMARFPEQSGVRLSALPTQDKVQLWKKDEESRAATEESDDDRPMEEIIQKSPESIVIVKKSPAIKSKPPKKLTGVAGLHLYKRKIRCKKCAGCLAKECGKCRHCLDKPKFGGPGTVKQACMKRRCLNPLIRRNATPGFIKTKDSETDSNAESLHSSPEKSRTSMSLIPVSLDLVERSAVPGAENSEVPGEESSFVPGAENSPVKVKGLESQTGTLVDDQTATESGIREDGTEVGNGGTTDRNMVPSSSRQGATRSEVRVLDFDSMPQVRLERVSMGRPSGKISSRLMKKLEFQQKFNKNQGNNDAQCYPVSLQNIIPASRQWGGILSQSSYHPIKVDFKADCDINSAWTYGLALTMSAAMSVRTLCFLCGSAGKHELIYCNLCCEPFHDFCLEEFEKPTREHYDNWVCSKCQYCHVCGRQNRLLQCDRCQNTYHPGCLGPNYPTKPSKKKNIWICTKCVKCKSCGATTPGSSSEATWTYDFSLCYECGKLMDKGNFCPICHKCYSDDDWESKMIQCNMCESWVHSRCEGLTDEMYEILSYLPEDLSFYCRNCHPQGCPEWERTLKRELQQGVENILHTLILTKSAQYILRQELKRSPLKVSPQSRVTQISPVAASPLALNEQTDLDFHKDKQSDDRNSDSRVDKTSDKSETDNVTLKDQTVCDSVPGESEGAERTDHGVCKLTAQPDHGNYSMKQDTDSSVTVVKKGEEDKELTKRCSENSGGTGDLDDGCVHKSSEQDCDTGSNVPMDVSVSEAGEGNVCDNSSKHCDINITEKPVTGVESCVTQETSRKAETSTSDQSKVINKTAISEAENKKVDVRPDRLLQRSVVVLNPIDAEAKEVKILLRPTQKQEVPVTITPVTAITPIMTITPVTAIQNVERNDCAALEENIPRKKALSVHFKIDDGEVTRERTPEPASPEKVYPKDLMAMVEEMKAGRYKSVAMFCEDILRIIQDYLDDDAETRTSRKKSIISARSCFVKQMEKIFPWFKVKSCQHWYSNKNMPYGMLPNATLPPSVDHTYSQWLERTAPPLSPQPSPFKKRAATPVKKIMPLDEDEGDVQTFLEGEDMRKCMFCKKYGDQDPDDAGRLLYCGQDDWCHINCALWSAEVYEDADGSLQNMVEAYSRGKQLRCDLCQNCGATVGCNTRGCKANYHFMCARQDRCRLQEDKKVFCWEHSHHVDREVLSRNRFRVLRRVFVESLRVRTVKKSWAKGLTAENIRILFGSCCVENLGRLTDLSDKPKFLQPVDFMSTRIYWSTKDARRRCVYTCRVIEVRPEQMKSPTVTIKDMRIVHDENHPDYVQLSRLDLSGIDLGLNSPAICEKSMDDVVDLTAATEDLTAATRDSSATLSGSEECRIISPEVLSMDKPLTSRSASKSLKESTGKSERVQESKLVRRASFSGILSHDQEKSQSRGLSSSWPRPKKKTVDCSSSRPDLSLLSPKTLKMLNIQDPSKYSSPSQWDCGNRDNEDCKLLKVAERLNQAASKSNKTDSKQRALRSSSVERGSPVCLSRSVSPVARQARSQSVDTVDSVKSWSVARPESPFGLSVSSKLADLPERPFSPPVRMLSRARSLSVDKEVSLSNSISAMKQVTAEVSATKAPNISGYIDSKPMVSILNNHVAISNSLMSPEPTPVDCSSPVRTSHEQDSISDLPTISESESGAEDIELVVAGTEASGSIAEAGMDTDVDCQITSQESSEGVTDIDNGTSSISLCLTDETGETQETIVVMTESGESLSEEEAIKIVQEVIESRSSSENMTQTSETLEDESGNLELDKGGSEVNMETSNGLENSANVGMVSDSAIDTDCILLDNKADERSDSPFVPIIDGDSVESYRNPELTRNVRLNRTVKTKVENDKNIEELENEHAMQEQHSDKAFPVLETSDKPVMEEELSGGTDEVYAAEESQSENTGEADVLDLTESDYKEQDEQVVNSSESKTENKILEEDKDKRDIDEIIEEDSDLELLYEIDNPIESDSEQDKEHSEQTGDVKESIACDTNSIETENRCDVMQERTNSVVDDPQKVDDNDLQTSNRSNSDEIDGEENKQVLNPSEMKAELTQMFSESGLNGDSVEREILFKCISVIEEEENGNSREVKYLGLDVDRKSPEILDKKIDQSVEKFEKSLNKEDQNSETEIQDVSDEDEANNDPVDDSVDSCKAVVIEIPEDDLVKEKVEDERDNTEKHEVLRGLGLGTCDEVEKIKNSPPKTPSPIKIFEPRFEQRLIRKRRYFQKSPLKIYPLRKSIVCPVRKDDTESFLHRAGNSEKLRMLTGGSADKPNPVNMLPVLDPISKKIKEESIAKSCPEEKGPFKCPMCRRMYRTETSYNAHVENCNFCVSSSEDETNDSDGEESSLISKTRKQVKLMRHRKRLLKLKRMGNLDNEKNKCSDGIDKEVEANPRSSLRSSTINQRVAMEVEEKRLKEEALKGTVTKQKGRPPLKKAVDAEKDTKINTNTTPNRMSTAHNNTEENTQENPHENRGRGRPRKNSLTSPEANDCKQSDREMRRKSRELRMMEMERESSESEYDTQDIENHNLLKRGRGRPRKMPLNDTDSAVAVGPTKVQDNKSENSVELGKRKIEGDSDNPHADSDKKKHCSGIESLGSDHSASESDFKSPNSELTRGRGRPRKLKMMNSKESRTDKEKDDLTETEKIIEEERSESSYHKGGESKTDKKDTKSNKEMKVTESDEKKKTSEEPMANGINDSEAEESMDVDKCHWETVSSDESAGELLDPLTGLLIDKATGKLLSFPVNDQANDKVTEEIQQCNTKGSNLEEDKIVEENGLHKEDLHNVPSNPVERQMGNPDHCEKVTSENLTLTNSQETLGEKKKNGNPSEKSDDMSNNSGSQMDNNTEDMHISTPKIASNPGHDHKSNPHNTKSVTDETETGLSVQGNPGSKNNPGDNTEKANPMADTPMKTNLLSNSFGVGLPSQDIPKAVLRMLKEGHKVVIKNPKLNKSFLWQKTENGYVGRSIDSKEFESLKSPKSVSTGQNASIDNTTGEETRGNSSIDCTSGNNNQTFQTASQILAARKKAVPEQTQTVDSTKTASGSHPVIAKQLESSSANVLASGTTNASVNRPIAPLGSIPLRAEYMGGVVIAKRKDTTIAQVQERIEKSAKAASNVLRAFTNNTVSLQGQNKTSDLPVSSKINVLSSLSSISVAARNIQPMISPGGQGFVPGSNASLPQPVLQLVNKPSMLLQPTVQQVVQRSPFPQFAQTGLHTLTGAQAVLGLSVPSLHTQTPIIQQSMASSAPLQPVFQQQTMTVSLSPLQTPIFQHPAISSGPSQTPVFQQQMISPPQATLLQQPAISSSAGLTPILSSPPQARPSLIKQHLVSSITAQTQLLQQHLGTLIQQQLVSSSPAAVTASYIPQVVKEHSMNTGPGLIGCPQVLGPIQALPSTIRPQSLHSLQTQMNATSALAPFLPPNSHSAVPLTTESTWTTKPVPTTQPTWYTQLMPTIQPRPTTQHKPAIQPVLPAQPTWTTPPKPGLQPKPTTQHKPSILTASSSLSTTSPGQVSNQLPAPRSAKYEKMKKFLLQRALMPLSKPIKPVTANKKAPMVVTMDRDANGMVKGQYGNLCRKPAYQIPAEKKEGRRKQRWKKRQSCELPKSSHQNVALPHSVDKASHPIIHPQKESATLPTAAVELEVKDVPLSDIADTENGSSGASNQNLGHLEYEITSDDGFACRSDSLDGAWKQVTEKVQDARAASRLKQLSYAGLPVLQMLGFSQPSVMYHVEQLYGANYCRKYKFKYHKHELAEQELELVNPSGCIRTELYNGRNPWDMFSFLLSRYRQMPPRQDRVQDEEMVQKSSRRATSMDLPMAMRFRKLKEHAKEAVGVYRSYIHGRGLFCKRKIDAGEMIIEYSGELIRNSMTDIREKYYESKGIGCYMFRIDDVDVVDATMKGSAARFINHSCEPNCYSKVITVDNRKHIVIFAMRPISRGEELTYDYKFPIEEVKIPCTCGSKKCRKYLN